MMVVFIASHAGTIALSAANGSLTLDSMAFLLTFTAFMVVGAVIVAHRPGNAIGWIFSAIGLLSATGVLAMEYAVYAYMTRPGSLPGPVLAAWYHQQWWFPMGTLIFVFTLLLFPTGRLLSPRWRPVAWLAEAVTAAIVALAVLQPTFVLESGRTVDNPIGVAAAANPDQSTAGTVLTSVLMLSVLAAFASLILRFRRSRGEERS